MHSVVIKHLMKNITKHFVFTTARAQTWTASFRVDRTYYETTAQAYNSQASNNERHHIVGSIYLLEL